MAIGSARGIHFRLVQSAYSRSHFIDTSSLVAMVQPIPIYECICRLNPRFSGSSTITSSPAIPHTKLGQATHSTANGANPPRKSVQQEVTAIQKTRSSEQLIQQKWFL